MKRFQVIGLAVCVTALLVAGCEEQKAEKAPVIRPVRAIQVSDATGLTKRWFPGRAKATQELDLSFRVSGPLIKRHVNVGSEVKKGAVIAQIDTATFRAEADQAKASLARAKANYKNAAVQLKRQRVLTEKGHQSEAALDRHIALESESKATVAAREAALKRTRLNLAYTTLKAPFAGVIVKTYAENFQDVRPKQPIVRLIDNSRIEMIVDIPENFISLAPSVKEAIVVFDAFPDIEVAATVKEIGTEASETTRTFPVTLIMDQPKNAKILPGMAGKATGKDGAAAAQMAESAVVVPETAIFTKENPQNTYVWVVNDNKTVATRPIKTGELTDHGIQVQDGVKPGEWIVTAGVNYLREGQQVRLLEE